MMEDGFEELLNDGPDPGEGAEEGDGVVRSGRWLKSFYAGNSVLRRVLSSYEGGSHFFYELKFVEAFCSNESWEWKV